MDVANAIFLVKEMHYRWLRGKARAEARDILAGVLASYRQMSDKPARDLMESLHNPRHLAGALGEQVAREIYDEVSGAASSQVARA